jgi:hypothetical protein
MVDAEASDLEVILNRIRLKLHELTDTREIPLQVQFSVGRTVTTDPPDTLDELLRAADLDMQRKRGRRAPRQSRSA